MKVKERSQFQKKQAHIWFAYDLADYLQEQFNVRPGDINYTEARISQFAHKYDCIVYVNSVKNELMLQSFLDVIHRIYEYTNRQFHYRVQTLHVFDSYHNVKNEVYCDYAQKFSEEEKALLKLMVDGLHIIDYSEKKQELLRKYGEIE